MKIQTPKSIAKVSSSVASYVRANFPNVFSIEDFPLDLQNKYENTCDHEMFYQDVNRFIGDVYQQKAMEN